MENEHFAQGALIETVKPFVPHPLLRGGHLQTVASQLVTSPKHGLVSEDLRVTLDDGDELCTHVHPPAHREHFP